MSKNQTHILFLGGGYLTVWAYRSLVRSLGNGLQTGQVKLTVVAPEPWHAFHGWTGEMLGGLIDMSDKVTDLRTLMPAAQFVCAFAESVDLQQQSVQVRLSNRGPSQSIQHRVLEYDHLVIGTGSSDNTDSVPGTRAHAYGLKGLGGELALKGRLADCLEYAESCGSLDDAQAALDIAFVGAGYAGVEACAAVGELYRAMKDRYSILQQIQPRIRLIDPSSRILSQLESHENLVVYAEQCLAEYGVEILTDARATEISDKGIQLADGRFVAANTVVSTLGQRRSIMAGTDSLSRDKQLRIECDLHLRVRGHENIWAGGDVASVPHPVTGEPCVSNALWAIKQGQRLGANLGRVLSGQSPRLFRFRGLGQGASLGIGKGMSELYGFEMTGWLSWIVRMFFFLYYMPCWHRALRVFFDTLTAPFYGRRFVAFSGPPRRLHAHKRPVQKVTTERVLPQRQPLKPLDGPRQTARNTPRRAIATVRHLTDPAELEALYEFRYRLHVTELGWTNSADHTGRRLVDELDAYSEQLATIRSGQVLGSMRGTYLDKLPSPLLQKLLDRYEMQETCEAFGSQAIVLVSRLLLDESVRGSLAIFRLMQAAYEHAVERGARFCIGDCSADLLDFYQHMGWKTYAQPFIDPKYGLKHPIVMALGDVERLTNARSPLARLARQRPADLEAAAWLTNTTIPYPRAA